MALCRITGIVYLPSGEIAARREVTFVKEPDTVTADYLGAVLPEPIRTRTDTDGSIDLTLITGNYYGFILGRGGHNKYTFRAIVPESTTADFADLIAAVDPVEPLPSWLQQVIEARDGARASEVAAGVSAGDAADSADLAAALTAESPQSWAQFADFLPYKDGKLVWFNEALFVRDSGVDVPGLLTGAGWRPVEPVSPMHYGAVADGATDDAVAIKAVIESGLLIDMGRRSYAHTGVVATTDSFRVLSSGATFLYTGPYVRYAFRITASFGASFIDGEITFDANDMATTSISLNSAAPDNTEVTHTLYVNGLIGSRAFRRDTTIAGGDGVIITGAWHIVEALTTKANDCYMAVGAEVLGSQGIFGITVSSGTGGFAKHVRITGPYVENIWSLDPLYFHDQDAIRVFQDITDPDATCQIDGWTVINAMGRAIKLHSGPNPIVTNGHRVMDASVMGHTVPSTTPDIDSQQGPATILNARFHYKGIWRSQVIRSHTDPGANNYFSSPVDTISLLIEDAAGNDVTMVGLTSSADGTTPSPDSRFQCQISNIGVKGQIASFVRGNLRGTAPNTIQVSNVCGDVSSAGVVLVGAANPVSDLQLVNVVNLGSAVPLVTGAPSNLRVSAVSISGFSDGLGYVSTRSTGVGVNGQSEAALDVYQAAVGSPRVRLRGQRSSVSELDFSAWYEIYHTALAKRLASLGFLATGTEDLELRNETTNGDIAIRFAGASGGIRVLRSGGLQIGSGTQPALLPSRSTTPEGAVTAPPGSEVTVVSGGSATKYFKQTGTGNTGWLPL